MLPQRTFRIQDDLQRTPKNYFTQTKKNWNNHVLVDKAKHYLKLFFKTSSIHGFNHLVSAKIHLLEIILWFTIIFLSGFGSLYLSQITWTRYQSSPTVVSMDRDMFAWNTTFPCVTVCPNNYIDKKKLEIYLRFVGSISSTWYLYKDVLLICYLAILLTSDLGTILWKIFAADFLTSAHQHHSQIWSSSVSSSIGYGISIKPILISESNEQNKTKLEVFIIALANASYKNFEKIPDYTDISPNKYIELLRNLSAPFTPTLTIGVSNVVLTMVPTVTEMGLCYAVNSKTAVYNSPEYRDANRWDTVIDEKKSLFIHPLDGEVFAQVMNISSAYDVYIHGPQEVPDVSTKFQHSAEGYYMKLYVTALTVYTSAEASKLSVNQRRCRFPHENNLKHNSIYTYTMCRMDCRIRLCLKYCRCIPHFYRKIGDEQYCDVKGLHCVAKYKDEIYKLQDKNGKRINCGCFPLCNDVNYVLQSNALKVWFLGTNLQWGMVTYPRMRYRRDIIFGFTDVLVSVGGMAGLFLGCSVLSFMEIVYFLTLRLFCYSHKS